MSFLEKIGLKKQKDSGSDVPPPPPAPKKNGGEDEKPGAKMDLPPLPKKEDASGSKIRDLPSRPPQEEDVPPAPKQKDASHAPKQDTPPAAPPAPEKHEDVPPAPQQPPKQAPPAPEQQSQAADIQPPKLEKPAPKAAPQPAAPKSASREDLRKAFDDVPPIKASQNRAESKITDEDVRNFQVDNMVLPEEQKQGSEQQAPRPKPSASKPASKETKPLFVDISTYEGIQKRIRDLKRQVNSAGRNIEGILKERKQEDKEFKKFVEELERIQDDLITIDEELFEEK